MFKLLQTYTKLNKNAKRSCTIKCSTKEKAE